MDTTNGDKSGKVTTSTVVCSYGYEMGAYVVAAAYNIFQFYAVDR